MNVYSHLNAAVAQRQRLFAQYKYIHSVLRVHVKLITIGHSNFSCAYIAERIISGIQVNYSPAEGE